MRDIVKKVLSNGIVVYLYHDKSLKRMVASYTVNYGTHGYYDQFEYDGKVYKMPPALAHFIEHTLMETSKYGNILHRFKEKNYEVNALTGPDFTSYYFIGIKDTWESLKELINTIDDVNYDIESIEVVKRAVIEETNKAKDDKYRAGFNANIRNLYAAFEACDESYNTLGTEETTKSITIDDVNTAYGAYYNDENKFLLIGGNFKVDEMIAYLESIYAELSLHKNAMKLREYDDLMSIRKSYEAIVKPVFNDYCLVTYKVGKTQEIDELKTLLYIDIYLDMTFGHDSAFVANLVKDDVIIGSLGFRSDIFLGVVTVTFMADVKNESKFLSLIEKEFTTAGLDREEFELIKKSYKVSDLAKRDAIYNALLKFPRAVKFSSKLFKLQLYEQLDFDEMKSLIDSLDWSIKTVTVLKKEK